MNSTPAPPLLTRPLRSPSTIRAIVRTALIATHIVSMTGITLADTSSPASGHASLSDAARRGASLYQGTTPLPARLFGHQRDLPPMATGCVNCHNPRAAQPRTPLRTGDSTEAQSDTANLGPPLDAASLISLRARRGGPPSRFDAVALCTLLRTGLDPAQVLIPLSMPRYAPSEADCRDLWAYLYERTSD